MFDIGFSELLVIGVVALVVIGPERLPKVARTAGHLYGRLQRYVSTVKSDISREVELDELKRTGQQFKDSFDSAASDIREQTTVVDDYLKRELEGVGQSVAAPAAVVAPAAVIEVARAPQQALPLDEPDQNPPHARA